MCQALRAGGVNRAQRIFRAGKVLIFKPWIRDVTRVSKPVGCVTPRVNPKVRCGLQLIMTNWGSLGGSVG